MGNDNERIAGTTKALEEAYRHPEKPSSERLKSFVLLGDGQCRADFASTLQEADEALNLGRILLAVLEMRLNLLNVLQCAAIGVNVVLTRLAGFVLRARRRRSSGEGAALGDEIGEL